MTRERYIGAEVAEIEQFDIDMLVASTKKFQFRDTGIYIQSGADGKLTIAADGSGTDDITLSGTITLDDDLITPTTKKVQFRDSGLYINSSADGKLVISADGSGSDDITLSGTVTIADAVTMQGKLDYTGITPTGTSPLILAGTSSVPLSIATADTKFIQVYVKNTATTGDNRGMYLREYLAGIGGGGEAARIFTTVDNVAAGTAHGAHISLNFNASGSITGLGVASRNTLHVPNAVMAAGGTYAAVQPEIYADGATSDPSGVTEMSFIRVVNDGNATGVGLIDDKANLITLSGGAIGAGNVMAVKTAAAVSHTLRIKGPNGTTYYLMVSDTQ